MRQGRFRLLAGWLLVVMLLSVAPFATGAGGEWKRIGSKVWLEPGKGINLATGGTGDDITFKGNTLTARHGMQVVKGSSSLDYDLVPPTSGYVTSLDTTGIVYSRLVVRLADGSAAQVRLGMASSGGFIYTGLFLEEWTLLQGAFPPGGSSETPAPTNRGTAILKLGSTTVEANGVAAVLDVGPRQIGGQVMLPLRFLGDAMGLALTWDAQEKRVSITGEGLAMTLWVDRSTAVINGQTVTLSQPATMVENRLLVPLTGVGEALAGKATYNAASGEITLGSAPAGGSPNPGNTSPEGNNQASAWPRHFSAIWLNGYVNGWASTAADARPDFYLTLNEDGTARVIQTITGLSYGSYYAINLEYKGTYTRNPLRVQLTLQPAIKGYETLEHGIPGWQSMTVTGDLTADMSRVDNLSVNGTAAKSGSASQAKRVPDPGEWK